MWLILLASAASPSGPRGPIAEPWAVLRLAAPIGNALGPIGLNIVNRLFGPILTAIAIEIMANGLKESFPLLAG